MSKKLKTENQLKTTCSVMFQYYTNNLHQLTMFPPSTNIKYPFLHMTSYCFFFKYKKDTNLTIKTTLTSLRLVLQMVNSCKRD